MSGSLELERLTPTNCYYYSYSRWTRAAQWSLSRCLQWTTSRMCIEVAVPDPVVSHLTSLHLALLPHLAYQFHDSFHLVLDELATVSSR